MSKRVVIIGAGPGGLASAMLLAKAGMDVEVLERQPRVGGRTTTIGNGTFKFDLGPTFFLYPRILKEIYQTAGYDLMREVPMVRLDPQYRLMFGDTGSIMATPNIAQMEREIAKICPADANSFRPFLERNRVKLDRFRPCLERPFLSFRDLLRPDLLKLLPILTPWRSLEADLGKFFSDPRIRLAFSFQSKYLGMSPFRCPSLFSILSFLEYEDGVWHPIGGCGAVTRSMADVARRLGAKVRINEPVEEILFDGRKAIGVRTNQRLYASDSIVINADFARAMTRLVPDELRRRWTDRKLAKKRFSCSAFMIYLGIEGVYEKVPHHTIYMSNNYERNLEDVETRHVLSDDPSFYVQNPSVTDPTLAPAGMSTLYILVPVTHRHPNVDWRAEKQRYRNLVLKHLEKIGIENVESRIRYEHIVTPDDWDETYEIHKGATFNLAHNLMQMLHLRPRNRFEDLDSVYLVGGGTHPGSGLPVIFESARITSRLLLEDAGASSALPVGETEGQRVLTEAL